MTTSKRSTAVTPTGVNHIVLHVRDIDEAHQFWSGLLGFRQVGELHEAPMVMRFYAGDTAHHHDLALMENTELPTPPPEWSLLPGPLAVNHLAITYPDRASWLEQIEFLRDQGVKVNARVNHGMTHSVYINDPNGYGVEVLYDLPIEVWGADVDGALNYAEFITKDQLLVDDTDYPTDFARG
jgi:catechol 2,3-dioxygenase